MSDICGFQEFHDLTLQAHIFPGRRHHPRPKMAQVQTLRYTVWYMPPSTMPKFLLNRQWGNCSLDELRACVFVCFSVHTAADAVHER
ncbi:hypothetical protein SNOG_12910 [Parastagonospora nodorum SN15]|uniref:Uncharacterized protein n=1 Tax=Phaeosphaeria nodorum (strain SN15 / ATCC MYA-4574 / FGSC 10173) TaxID=321614 RepID=Q0U5Q4_PHANO|nr:hypothetical protein SNOG_12910 [Parastagonospora nodorum SN15]EAT79710.1 hypothetical protein SNOG_12910 [Parastagonospora nodorum SN15]